MNTKLTDKLRELRDIGPEMTAEGYEALLCECIALSELSPEPQEAPSRLTDGDGWISVKDRLPEPGKYLAWQRDIGETVAHYYGPGKGINGWSMASIVSWRKLPDPPTS